MSNFSRPGLLELEEEANGPISMCSVSQMVLSQESRLPSQEFTRNGSAGGLHSVFTPQASTHGAVINNSMYSTPSLQPST